MANESMKTGADLLIDALQKKWTAKYLWGRWDSSN